MITYEVEDRADGKSFVICHRLSARTVLGWMLAAYIGALSAKFTYDVVHDHPQYEAMVKAARDRLLRFGRVGLRRLGARVPTVGVDADSLTARAPEQADDGHASIGGVKKWPVAIVCAPVIRASATGDEAIHDASCALVGGKFVLVRMG